MADDVTRKDIKISDKLGRAYVTSLAVKTEKKFRLSFVTKTNTLRQSLSKRWEVGASEAKRMDR